jgi:pyruvate formate lyase activating enzyme
MKSIEQTKEKDLNWLFESGLRDAWYWERQMQDTVKCNICPRNCIIKNGNFGFCKTRINDNGVLKTAIWGKQLTPSIEPIETEAVFHFWPGAKILSLGNLGCNLSCDFCQNWESSDISNLKPEYVNFQTPEQIITLAKTLGIKVIAFTYNDPAIWFEFVYETAKLANDNGIKTLYKSAAFTMPAIAKKLTEVIDIFSISLKAMNPKTFLHMSKGRLGNVLDAIKIFYASGKHLELSNLIVTGLTDVKSEVKELSLWVKNELSDNVPLHFVRFHPAYKYLDVERTSVSFLEESRDIALEVGMKYVYIGNTYQDGHADIYCKSCNALQVKRFGLYTHLQDITEDGSCRICGNFQNITVGPQGLKNKLVSYSSELKEKRRFEWKDIDIRNLHLEMHNPTNTIGGLVCEHLNHKGTVIKTEQLSIPVNTAFRFAIGQTSEAEAEIRLKYSDNLDCCTSELLDRAHFPLETMV